jgi:hypothetical protein
VSGNEDDWGEDGAEIAEKGRVLAAE